MGIYHGGQLEDTRGSLWIFVDLCGSLWIFVDICGYLWIFVDIASSLIYMLVGLYGSQSRIRCDGYDSPKPKKSFWRLLYMILKDLHLIPLSFFVTFFWSPHVNSCILRNTRLLAASPDPNN